MKKILYLICLLIILTSCKTEYNRVGGKNSNYIPYYLKVYEADSLYSAGNYNATFYLLDSLFKKYEPIELLFINEYSKYVDCKSIILGSKSTYNDIRKMSVTYGYDFSEFDNNDSIFNDIINKNSISIKKIKKWRRRYLNTIHYNIKDSLLKIFEYDQKYRKDNDDNFYRDNIKSQNFLDSINRIKLKYIFEKYGFPNERLTGSYNLDNPLTPSKLSVILTHLPIKDYDEYFKPTLLKFIRQGTCHPFYYVVIDDRVNVAKGFPCNYGFYCESNEKTSIINVNRKALGLKNIKPKVCNTKRQKE